MSYFQLDYSAAFPDLQSCFNTLRSRFAPDSPLSFQTLVPNDPEPFLATEFVLPMARDFTTDIESDLRHMRTNDLVLMRMCTGAGKTTRIPFELYRVMAKTIVVIQPTGLLARAAFDYVSRARPEAKFYDGRGPFPSGVVYTSARSVLQLLATGQGISGYVYLDESHTKTPEYVVLCLLMQKFKLSGALVSATHGPEVLFGAKRQHDIGVTLIEARGDMSGLLNLLSTHFSPERVVNRVILFVPDNDAVECAVRVFKGFVPYVSFRYGDGHQRFAEIVRFMTHESPRILITVDVLSTGVTIPADTVWDFGMTIGANFSGPPYAMSIQWFVAAVGDIEQRKGRVGRLSAGKYVGVRRDYRGETDSFGPSDVYRMFAWLKLLGAEPPLAMRKQYPAMGKMSNTLAAAILSCPLHPMMVRPFFDTEGRLYRNTVPVFKRIIPITPADIADSLLDLDNSSWPQMTYRHPNLREGTIVTACHVLNVSQDIEMIVAMIRTVKSYHPGDIYEDAPAVRLRMPQFYSHPAISTTSVASVSTVSVESIEMVTTFGRPTIPPRPRLRSDTPDYPELPRRRSQAVNSDFAGLLQPVGSVDFGQYAVKTPTDWSTIDTLAGMDRLQLVRLQYEIAHDWNDSVQLLWRYQRLVRAHICCGLFNFWYRYRIQTLRNLQSEMKPILTAMSALDHKFEPLSIPNDAIVLRKRF